MCYIIKYMKKLFFILTFVSFLIPFPLQATCSDIVVNPQIEFKTSYGKLSYNFNKNNQQITDIAEQLGIIEKGIFAAGLSTINIKTDIVINSVGDRIDDYSLCVYPQKISISIYFSNPTIYISNQLIPNSCQYNVVLRHEQTHQQINKNGLDYFLPLFYTGIKKISSSIKPRKVNFISDIDKASKNITDEFNEKLSPLVDFFKQQLLSEQIKLDNTENYKHENGICQ